MVTESKVGNYIVGKLIGRGGMGIVYRGRHMTLPREVAIKSINARGGRDLRRLRHRFEREAYIQSQLDHPAIVKIYDYIVAEQTYYIVMEHVEGRSLAQLIASEGRPLPVERALDLFEQILAAVAYAHNFTYRDQDGSTHRGIIHRDLKPPNILVAPDDRIKITDFGIVKLVGADTTDTFGTAYGSPRYVSPEQADGAPVDQRSDLYSLGVILYEMLTARPPFGGEDEALSRTDILRAHIEEPPWPPAELNAEIPPDIEGVILRALEKRPERRFATAVDFWRAVRHARGRSTDGLAENLIFASPAPQQSVNREGAAAGKRSDSSSRESYVTQPIPIPSTATCGACGVENEPEARRCRVCGHELSVSPATANLTRLDITSRARARGIWIVTALFATALASASVIYYSRRPANPGTREAVTEASPAVAAAPASTPAPLSALVALRPARVEVDSSFDGYGIAPLTDDIIDVRRITGMRYNEGNWASAETPVPHWIEIGLAEPSRVAAVYVYWGFDRGRFMPSRRAELQVPDERGEWRTISIIEPENQYDRTAFEFAPVTISRLRILQPAQQGPTNRPFVMWVREFKVFGVGAAPSP